ncbi:MAG: hypothetical protein AAGJ97_03060 [Planctomycetota bacterium]
MHARAVGEAGDGRRLIFAARSGHACRQEFVGFCELHPLRPGHDDAEGGRVGWLPDLRQKRADILREHGVIDVSELTEKPVFEIDDSSFDELARRSGVRLPRLILARSMSEDAWRFFDRCPWRRHAWVEDDDDECVVAATESLAWDAADRLSFDIEELIKAAVRVRYGAIDARHRLDRLPDAQADVLSRHRGTPWRPWVRAAFLDDADAVPRPMRDGAGLLPTSAVPLAEAALTESVVEAWEDMRAPIRDALQDLESVRGEAEGPACGLPVRPDMTDGPAFYEIISELDLALIFLDVFEKNVGSLRSSIARGWEFLFFDDGRFDGITHPDLPDHVCRRGPGPRHFPDPRHEEAAGRFEAAEIAFEQYAQCVPRLAAARDAARRSVGEFDGAAAARFRWACGGPQGESAFAAFLARLTECPFFFTDGPEPLASSPRDIVGQVKRGHVRHAWRPHTAAIRLLQSRLIDDEAVGLCRVDNDVRSLRLPKEDAVSVLPFAAWAESDDGDSAEPGDTPVRSVPQCRLCPRDAAPDAVVKLWVFTSEKKQLAATGESSNISLNTVGAGVDVVTVSCIGLRSRKSGPRSASWGWIATVSLRTNELSNDSPPPVRAISEDSAYQQKQMVSTHLKCH